MMRRTPLQRKTRLKHGGQPLRTQRRSETQVERDARKLVRRRAGEWCELRIPGVCLGPMTNYQHRLPVARGGPTTASNGIGVCGMGNLSGCHGYLHKWPIEAVEKGWTVESGKDWRDVPVLLFDGFVLLDDDGHRLDPPSDCNAEEA